MKHINLKHIAIASVLVLFGAGCVTQAPQAVHETGKEVFEPSNSDVVTNASYVCTEVLVSNIYEHPELLPNSYPNLKATGSLFTMADCGENRLRELLDESSDELTVDRVIILKAKQDDTDGLRVKLEEAGFLCGDDIAVEGCHTRQAGTRVDDLLALKPFANEIDLDYFEEISNAFDQGE